MPQDVLSAMADVVQVVAALASLLVAWRALRVAQDQLKPLRKALEAARAEEKRRAGLKGELPTEHRRLVGFDPRFTNRDWNNVLADGGARPATLTSDLSRSYSEFYRDLRGTLRASSSRGSVIIVDLMFIPQLLQEQLIAPLPSDKLDLDDLLGRRAELLGVRLEAPAVEVVRRLCTGADGVLGALPLWINTHGRILPEAIALEQGRRIDQVASFDQLLDHEEARRLLCEAGVQSHYIIFEFLAHLAYRGCRVFRTVGANGFTSDLLDQTGGERRRFAEATADVAVRLLFYSETATMFRGAVAVGQLKDADAFRLEHAGDARSIRERIALWKPLFSSELLWRTLPQRNSTPLASLTNEREFRPPFARHEGPDRSYYLSALGGYGLALPIGAARDADSLRALRFTFLSNPLLMHPYVNDMLPAEGGSNEIDDFVSRYSRPRWPFWPRLEEFLNDTLLRLLLLLPKEARDDDVRSVWHRCVHVVEQSDESSRLLSGFLGRVEETAQAAGWTFVR